MNDTAFVDAAQEWDTPRSLSWRRTSDTPWNGLRWSIRVARTMPDDAFRQKQREAFDFDPGADRRGLALLRLGAHGHPDILCHYRL